MKTKSTALIKQNKNRINQSFKALIHSFKRNWSLYLLITPVLVYFAVFVFWPMYGIIIAFKDFRPNLGVFGSEWVGFKYFQDFFTSMHFTRTLRNTLTLSIYTLAVGFPLPIILAIMMNDLRSSKFKKAVQTITYLPHFISMVVLCGMITLFFRSETGLVNLFIQQLGGESVGFLNTPQYFKHIYVWTGIWQNLGWNTIIYMAALSGMDVQLLEAAAIDGANKFQKIRYIILPYLMPTAILLLILESGYIMSVGFEKVFLLQTDLNMEMSDVISTLVYRKGITEFQFSFSAAVGLFNSVVNCAILLFVNNVSKRLGKTSLW